MGHRPSPARSVHAVAFSYFANAFVPRSGEVARCAALNQTDDIPVDQLFGTVITERVVDFVMLFGLVGFALLTNLDAFLQLMNEAQLPATPTLAGLAVLGATGTGLVVAFPTAGSRWHCGQGGQFLARHRHRHSQRACHGKEGAVFGPHSSFGRCISLMSYVLFKAIPAVSSLGLTDAVLVMVAGGFGMVLPAPRRHRVLPLGGVPWLCSSGFLRVTWALPWPTWCG